MAFWGLDYFAAFDVLQLGWFWVAYLAGFLYVFTYLSIRAFEDDPYETSLKITGGLMVAVLFFGFTSLPSVIVGVLLVIIYSLIAKHVLKTNFSNWLFNFIILWILFSIFALVPDGWRYVMTGFAIIYIYIQSEFQIKKLKKEKEKSNSNK